jgi:glycosyltransferase involved in cell wall biosynthesis
VSEWPLRVCHLIDANLDTPYFRALARHHALRYPVTIGSLAPDGPLQDAMRALATPTFALGADGRSGYPRALLRMRRLLQSEGISILHAHCFDPTLLGLVAARSSGLPFVFTRHHADHHIRLGKRGHVWIDGWCARHADHVIAVSAATRRIMIDVEHVPAERISVVHNGIEPLAPPRAERLALLHRELALEGRPVCLVLARLHEEKGHLVLFEAIPRVLESFRDVLFLLAGDGPHRTRFEDAVRQKGLGGAVRFLGRRDDVPELLAVASLVVLPSLAESFGFVLVEAMSVGVPVVASATGGVPEVVEDGGNGLLVPPGQALPLAEAILALLRNPDRRRSLGEAGRARARQFTAQAMVRGYEKIYDRFIRISPE